MTLKEYFMMQGDLEGPNGVEDSFSNQNNHDIGINLLTENDQID